RVASWRPTAGKPVPSDGMGWVSAEDVVAWHGLAGGGAQAVDRSGELGLGGVVHGFGPFGGERTETMNNTIHLPHHRLHVYGVAREMLLAVRDARVRD